MRLAKLCLESVPTSMRETGGCHSLQMKSCNSAPSPSSAHMYDHRALQEATVLICPSFAAPIQKEGYPHPVTVFSGSAWWSGTAPGERHSLGAALAGCNSQSSRVLIMHTPQSCSLNFHSHAQEAFGLTQDRAWALGNSA